MSTTNLRSVSPLGKSPVAVTTLAFGTAPLGGLYAPVESHEASAALAAALTAGIRYVDTAPLYGYGLAEERLGEALSVTSEPVVVSTKVGRMLRPATTPGGQFHGTLPLEAYVDWSARAVRRSLTDSLARLGLKRADIAMLHDPLRTDLDEVVGVAYPELAKLREEGLVSAIGVGVNHPADAVAVLEQVELDCVLIAGRLTLLDQSASDELLPLCAARGVAVLAAGVFNSGILASSRPAEAYFHYERAPTNVVDRAVRLGEICASYGVPLPAAALQFPLREAAVSAVVVGMRSRLEVEENVRLFAHPIPNGLWEELAAELARTRTTLDS